MKLVVLTGSIACGKSMVGHYMSDKYGITIIDSDKITMQLQQPGAEAYKRIVATFGEKFLNDDKTINRKELGNLVFNDFSQRRKLNRIVHPLVLKTIFFETVKHWLKREKIVVLDIPLFFEIHMKKMYFDEVVTVALKPETQLQRLMKRNGLDENAAQSRIKSQMPIEKKCEMSTYVINNDGDIEQTKAQVDKFINYLNQKQRLLTRYPDPLFVIFIILSIIILAIFILS